MWIIAILVGCTIIGGPIGFIIGIAIVGYMIYSREKKNNIEVQNSNQSNQQYSQNLSLIQQLTPCIDIVCYFALKYEGEWTTEKVQYVKSCFDDCCETKADELYFRERLKKQNRPSLNISTQQWLELNPNQESREIIFDIISQLLVNTCQRIENIRHDAMSFGTSIGLSYPSCHQKLEILLNRYFQQETNTHQSELEKASELLGVRLNATEHEIQKAYRIKMKDFHPDRNVNVTPAVQRMLEEQTHLLNDARDLMLKSVAS